MHSFKFEELKGESMYGILFNFLFSSTKGSYTDDLCYLLIELIEIPLSHDSTLNIDNHLKKRSKYEKYI